MRKSFGILLLLLAACFRSGAQDNLILENFKNPPREARPRVWWHWMNANITKDGIRKDLLWMDEAGIVGFHNFDAGLETPQVVGCRLPYMSPEWKDAFNYALDIADSLNMEVTIASSPGWSETGGPWVSKEDAMKKVTWRDTVVSGKGRFKGKLPEPIMTCGDYQYHLRYHDDPHRYDYYRDIAVIAIKLSDDDRTMYELGVKETRTDDSIIYEFPKPQTIRSYTYGMEDWTYGRYGYALECSDDGVEYRTVSPSLPDINSVMKTVDIPATTARFFRIRNVLRDEWILTSFSLSPMTRVNIDNEKAGFSTSGSMREFWPTPETDDAVAFSDVIDLTSKYRNGVLNWNVPDGRWKIFRFGYNLTGKHNSPASPEATGLEVDKMDADAVRRYYKNYLGMYDDASHGRLGSVISHIMMDSYEAKWQNWTPKMREEFKSRRGYDMIKWFPALTGQIIGSSAETEKFLSDWRLTIGELIVENHYDVVNGILAPYGMKRYTESQEATRAYLADGMDVKRYADIPMSAFWIRSAYSSYSQSDADIHESASVAHIYGQNVCAAESFTNDGLLNPYGKRAYAHSPASLKPAADAAMAAGLNRFVIHCSVHQPSDSLVPGLGLGKYGQWFNRHETWAGEAKVWTDYLTRSSWMLQQGRFVADIAYFYGESTNLTARFKLKYPVTPQGYAYDFVSRNILLNVLKIKGDKLVSDSGMEYSVLVVDNEIRYFSEEIKARLEEIKAAGIPVVGPDEAEAALISKGIRPDFVLVSPAIETSPYVPEKDIRVVHRHLSDGELYWIANICPEYRNLDIAFKVSGLVPLVLHADSGRTEAVSYSLANGYTTVKLKMVPDDAQFVLFSGKAEKMQCLVPETLTSVVSTLEGPWNLSFQTGRGAPEKAVFPELQSLDKSSDPGIKYFSGTVNYTGTFELDTVPEGECWIDLGKVHHIAHVFLNGKDLGTAWKQPYRVDAGEALKKGSNTIEIRVTDSWVNRLVGDAQPGAEKITYTAVQFYNAEDKTLPSGLEGPVRIMKTN